MLFEERQLRLDGDGVGRHCIDHRAAEALARERRRCGSEVRVAAKLDGEQIHAWVETDDELALLLGHQARHAVAKKLLLGSSSSHVSRRS